MANKEQEQWPCDELLSVAQLLQSREQVLKLNWKAYVRGDEGAIVVKQVIDCDENLLLRARVIFSPLEDSFKASVVERVRDRYIARIARQSDAPVSLNWKVRIKAIFCLENFLLMLALAIVMMALCILIPEDNRSQVFHYNTEWISRIEVEPDASSSTLPENAVLLNKDKVNVLLLQPEAGESYDEGVSMTAYFYNDSKIYQWHAHRYKAGLNALKLGGFLPIKVFRGQWQFVLVINEGLHYGNEAELRRLLDRENPAYVRYLVLIQ